MEEIKSMLIHLALENVRLDKRIQELEHNQEVIKANSETILQMLNTALQREKNNAQDL